MGVKSFFKKCLLLLASNGNDWLYMMKHKRIEHAKTYEEELFDMLEDEWHEQYYDNDDVI